MSEEKKIFYKTLNNIVATNRIDNEESYILNNYISCLESALQQKENIIKEVREYIEEHLEREYFDYDILEANTIYNRDLYKVLKILDKAGNSNERNKDNK